MFAQIIRFRTSKWDELVTMSKEYEATQTGAGGPQRVIAGRDREHPDRGSVIAIFESYEKAMENSKLPDTDAWFRKLSQLLDGAPEFENLDIVHFYRSPNAISA